MATPVSREEFDVATLPVTTVTVYSDRAEVKRVLKTKAKQGTNEIVVQKLAPCMEAESIRVDGRGKATIADVLFQEKATKKEDQLRQEEKAIEQKRESLEAERKRLEREEPRLRKLRQTLDDLIGSIGRAGGTREKKLPESPSSMAVTKTHLAGLDSLQEFYVSRATKLDEQIMAVVKKRSNLTEEINVVLGSLASNQDLRGGKERSVSILLDVKEAGEIELHISYMVRKASWKPSYDTRVYSVDRKVKLHYYGMVQQYTGESWNDVKLLLSTATPSIGGRIPELGTLQASLVKPDVAPKPKRVSKKKKCKSKKSQKETESQSEDTAQVRSGHRRISARAMKTAEVTVKDAVLSTSFEIGRSTTIPSDNARHKVTIAVIDLKPNFEYETVPSKVQMAFLKALVVNTSPYPLLRGPTAIYWDNSFVAKSSLKAVSPQEAFSCSLGADPAVRIEQKPVKKFLEESALWFKPSLETREQKTIIKNTRTDAIQLTMISPIPRSTVDKVKVELLEPKLTELVRLTPENHLECKLRVNAGEAKEITVKYTIEYPKRGKLVFEEIAS